MIIKGYKYKIELKFKIGEKAMSEKKRSIRREVFYWGLLLFFFIMVLFTAILIKPRFDRDIADARGSIERENSRINGYMESMFEETDAVLEELVGNRTVIDVIDGGEPSKSEALELYDMVKHMYRNVTHVFSGYRDGTMIIGGYELKDGFDPRVRPWYKAASQEKDRSVRTSYTDSNSGEWLFSTSRAILDESGEVLGVIGMDISNERLSENLKSSYKYETQRSYIINDKRIIMVNAKNRFLGEDLVSVVGGLRPEEISGDEGEFDYELEGKEYWAHYRRIDGTNFYSVTAIDSEEVLCPILETVGVTAITITLCAIAVGLLQNRLLKKRFVDPFMELSERIRNIAEEKEDIGLFYKFKNRELIEAANDIERIARKSIEDKERLLRASEDKYRKLVENLSRDYFIYILDKEGKLNYVSPSVKEMLGYTEEELLGGNIDFKGGQKIEKIEVEEDCTDTDSTVYELEVSRKDGRKRYIEVTEILLKNELGETYGTEGIAKDITDMKERQRKIEFLSFYDAMTGLYNRRFFEEELKRLDSERNYPLTLLYADINGLKLANDIFGHTVGDELISRVAENIKRECRKDDIISRMGGDEFAIILPKTEESEVSNIVDRIKAGLSEERVEELVVSVSFGWATKNKSGVPMEDVLKKADELMYKKKLYESPEMRKKTVERIVQRAESIGIVKKKLGESEIKLLEKLGSDMELGDKERQTLEKAYRFRNIGEIALDLEVLKKIGKLTDEEWKSVKRHPELGYRILSSTPEYSDIADYVLNHHERWDGRGYPKGKSGQDIPMISRIIYVVEAYIAMTEEKHYNGGIKSRDEVMEELDKNAGTQFDPEILKRLSN